MITKAPHFSILALQEPDPVLVLFALVYLVVGQVADVAEHLAALAAFEGLGWGQLYGRKATRGGAVDPPFVKQLLPVFVLVLDSSVLEELGLSAEWLAAGGAVEVFVELDQRIIEHVHAAFEAELVLSALENRIEVGRFRELLLANLALATLLGHLIIDCLVYVLSIWLD